MHRRAASRDARDRAPRRARSGCRTAALRARMQIAVKLRERAVGSRSIRRQHGIEQRIAGAERADRARHRLPVGRRRHRRERRAVRCQRHQHLRRVVRERRREERIRRVHRTELPLHARAGVHDGVQLARLILPGRRDDLHRPAVERGRAGHVEAAALLRRRADLQRRPAGTSHCPPPSAAARAGAPKRCRRPTRRGHRSCLSR